MSKEILTFIKHFSAAFLTLSLCFFSLDGNSQNQLLPLNYFSKQQFQRAFSSVDSSVQTSFWPQLENQHPLDSVYGYTDNDKYYYGFTRKLFRDHLVEVKGKDFRFSFDIVHDFQLGYDFVDTSTATKKRIFNNTRGFVITGDIGKRVSFATSVYENQARFPNQINHLVDSLGVIPGQGRVKTSTGKDIGYDFNEAYGVLSIQANDWLNFQYGHGKHFIGNGYRSVLLSDIAFNYPYLQASFLRKKVQYMFWYSSFQTLKRLPLGEVPESLFERKSGNFYYLNFIPHPRVEIGLFEGVIWKDWDETEGTLPFEGKKLIPIIGINSLITDFEQTRLGLNTKIKITNSLNIYSQIEFVSTIRAMQYGINFLNVGIKNLDVQFEYNQGNSYSSNNVISQYDHYNQPLAHPLNQNYKEYISIINYRYKRWQNRVKYIYQDEMIFNRNKHILDIETSLLLNPKTNMNLTLGWTYREDNSSISLNHTQWLYFAFRTSLWNKYYDY